MRRWNERREGLAGDGTPVGWRRATEASGGE